MPDFGAGLQWLPSIDAWETCGEQSIVAIGADALGQPLPAGWYELSGTLHAEGTSFAQPSLRLHYVSHSALTDLEVMLPEPDRTGRLRVLLLLLEDVESLELVPGIGAMRFRMHDFRLRRVTRTRALLMMLRGPSGLRPGSLVARTMAWTRKAAAHGPRRATDQLYADYGRLLQSSGTDSYTAWIRKYDTDDPVALERFNQRARSIGDRGPLVSVLLRPNAAPVEQLRRCFDSVFQQAWQRWELCVVDTGTLSSPVMQMLDEYAARHGRVRIAGRGPDASNEALAVVRGDFVALLDGGHELRPHALLCMAEAVAADRDLAMLYSDEDWIAGDGGRCRHHFKPDWDPDLMRGRDYVGHLVMIRTALMREVGGFREAFGESRDYDLVLRCSELVPMRGIRHIAAVLCHQVAPDAAGESNAAGAARLRAVTEHLRRTGSAAKVEAAEATSSVRIRWPLPQPPPRISLIVPTRDRADLLRACVESMLAKTTYPDFELLVVDNRSTSRAALDYLRELETRERVRVLRYDAPFNYPAINNWAVRQCSGQVIGLVNNDIEVITPDWLEEMAGLALRPDTGAVGAMLYYPDDTIQHAGIVLGLFAFAGHVHAGKPRGHRGYHDRARMVQGLAAVTGACLLVRREVYEAVGGLDENLPVEFNDIDFCLRARQRGYRNVWTPHAELYHHESATRLPEDMAARRQRFAEITLMQRRWGSALREDPAYNPNLSLQSLEFELGFPPRTRFGEVSTRPLL